MPLNPTALKEFFEFLSIPSVSSEPSHHADVLRAADWVERYLKGLGFQTERWETPGFPTLFAHFQVNPSQPTLLIYNHYDVQPVDPLPLWTTPPFTPTIREGEVYARGAQDNKGQCFYVLQALKSLLEKKGTLPLNIKLCIEGEEEVGSAGLASILERHSKALQADYLAIVDVGIPASHIPSVTLGVRGLVSLDVTFKGSSTDLHSGSHGGIAYNPIHALIHVLAEARHPDGSIAIPRFYDGIQSGSKDDFDLIFDPQQYQEQFKALPVGGETRYSPLERNWLRPTLEINGISGGYAGDGFKTVIPAEAKAKLSCRLVPGQDPQKIGECVTEFLLEKAPKSMQVDVRIRPGTGLALRALRDSKGVQAFAQAFSEVFEQPCRFILDGASIPVVSALAQLSGAETVLVGLGLSTDKIHAPNEHFGLDRLERGQAVIVRALEILGEG